MRLIRTYAAAFALAALSLTAFTAGASADSRMFVAYLYGGNERPVAGDPDAFGIATVEVVGAGGICYSIIVQNAAAATVAHIHAGAAGAVGGPVLGLPVGAALPTRVGNCIAAAPALVTAIRANPQNFYVNVHNAAFPGGAVRGQLQ